MQPIIPLASPEVTPQFSSSDQMSQHTNAEKLLLPTAIAPTMQVPEQNQNAEPDLLEEVSVAEIPSLPSTEERTSPEPSIIPVPQSSAGIKSTSPSPTLETASLNFKSLRTKFESYFQKSVANEPPSTLLPKEGNSSLVNKSINSTATQVSGRPDIYNYLLNHLC